MMDTWLKDELTKISESDDLHVSPFREDGVTYGTAKGGANHCAVLPAAWYPHVVIYELATHNHFDRYCDGMMMPHILWFFHSVLWSCYEPLYLRYHLLGTYGKLSTSNAPTTKWGESDDKGDWRH